MSDSPELQILAAGPQWLHLGAHKLKSVKQHVKASKRRFCLEHDDLYKLSHSVKSLMSQLTYRQWGVSVLGGDVWVGSMFQKIFYTGHISLMGCQQKSRLVLQITSVH